MWKAGLDRARTELQGEGRGSGPLTDVTAMKGGSGERGRQGPGLLTCPCHSGWRPGQGWPSPRVGNSCFDLCWWRGHCSVGNKEQGCVQKARVCYGPGHSTCFPSTSHHKRVWLGKKGVAFTWGLGLHGVQKRRQVGSQRQWVLTRRRAAWRGQARLREGQEKALGAGVAHRGGGRGSLLSL